MFTFYRLNANFSFRRDPYRTNTRTVFRYFYIKNLISWNLFEKSEPYRDEVLYEKSLKIDIYAERFALTALFSCKNEIFSSADRAFYKNAQIFTPVWFALTLFLELICIKIIAEQFSLLK